MSLLISAGLACAATPQKTRLPSPDPAEPQYEVQRSFFFLQTPAHQHSLNTGLRFRSGVYGLLDAGTRVCTVKDVSTEASLEYEYGISSIFSTALKTAFLTRSMDYTLDPGVTKRWGGLEDIAIILRSHIPWNSHFIFASLAISGSPAQRSLTADSSTQTNGNAYSGGFSIEPSVGAQYRFSEENVAGALFSRRVLFERTTDYTSSGKTVTGKTTGGSQTSVLAYYEYQMDASAIDAYAGDVFKESVINPIADPDAIQAGLIFGLAYSTMATETLRLSFRYDVKLIPESNDVFFTGSRDEAHGDHTFTITARFAL